AVVGVEGRQATEPRLARDVDVRQGRGVLPRLPRVVGRQDVDRVGAGGGRRAAGALGAGRRRGRRRGRVGARRRLGGPPAARVGVRRTRGVAGGGRRARGQQDSRRREGGQRPSAPV